MKNSLKSIIVAAFAALAFQGNVNAETKKAPAKPAEAAAEAKPKKDTYPLYGEVVSITASTLTIKGGVDKPDRKYAITADTKIVNGDKDAKASDVKEGAWVGGLLKKAAKTDPVGAYWVARWLLDQANELPPTRRELAMQQLSPLLVSKPL